MKSWNVNEMTMSIVSDFEKNVHMSNTDICVYYHEHLECFVLLNQSEMHLQMKSWKDLLKLGKMFILQENCVTLTIKGVEYFILVVQGANLALSPSAFLFDELFLVNGFIYMFRTKKTRDAVFNWLEKFCQVTIADEYNECLICRDEDEKINFVTKCCKQPLCACCLKKKNSLCCPFCGKEC